MRHRPDKVGSLGRFALAVLAVSAVAGSCSSAGGPSAPSAGLAEAAEIPSGHTPTAGGRSARLEPCEVDADCSIGDRCVAESCRRRCAVDADCAAAPCDLSTGTCTGSPCERDSQCDPGEACREGRCRPDASAPICRPHTSRCRGADLLSCRLDGLGETVERCERPCVTDGAGSHCGEDVCQPSAIGCRNARVTYVCSADGTALEVAPCGADQYCDRGACRPMICEPDTTWCSGDTLVTCDPAGRAYDTLDCLDAEGCEDQPARCICREAACQQLTCVPGTGRCVAAGLQRCNDTGSGFLPAETCGPNHACRDGACRATVCQPGTRECDGDVLRVCDATGTRFAETDCLAEDSFCAGEAEAAQCRPQICRPGASTCNEAGTAVMRCDERGIGTEEIPCADWGCSAGACLPEPAPDGWVRIEPGRFSMGSPPDEPGRTDYETRHEVRLTRAFFIQETEATQGQWEAVMGSRPAFFADCGPDCPVECVSFYDILAFANRLSEQEGRQPCYDLDGCRGDPGGGCAGEFLCLGDFVCETATFRGLDCPGYRLPTEAEWEYAARAGTETAFHDGPITQLGTDPVDPNLARIAWYGGNSEGNTHPTGVLAPNAWGLHDVSGNVFELVWDWFTVDYETLGPVDPIGPPWGVNRVARGGSWYGEAVQARSAYRHNLDPTHRVNSFGFRLVRTSLSLGDQNAD